VAVTEPRVLVPEEPARDTRPRWIVLTIVDDLRGDQIDGPEADASCPQLAKLARAGHSYRAAISPGCHTLAAVPQILAGRDLMRIDPVQRLMSPTLNRIGPASKEAIYSRGSLFVTEMAESVGYHSVFLGNNGFLAGWPAFSRASIQNNSTTGTVDTAERLPDLLSRYADERVMLVYYISAPHAHSATPRRLFESFGCGALSGIEEARCAYKARVRHGDEGLAALEAALQDNGLSDRTLQIITADHGENFHDSPPHERLRVGVLSLRSDEAHGSGCGLTELRVPLVVTGPAVEPAVWSAPVSALDIVPTILSVLRMSPVNRLDGEALPLMARDGVTTPARAFASYGFCNESFFDGNAQLLWWQSDCTERRSVEGSPRTHTLELWQGGTLKATEVGEPQVVGPKVGQLKAWIASRLPSQALLLDASRLPPSTVTVTALEGEIKDFGPSSTVDGLAAIRGVRLDKVSKSVEIAFDGYRGLYYVATDPETAPVTVKVASQDGARLELPLFLGPLQIPVAASGRPIRPREDHELLVARGTPDPQPGDGLRLWWQPYGAVAVAVREQSPSDIDRVLREWGYVR
jgi:hypothetical protein